MLIFLGHLKLTGRWYNFRTGEFFQEGEITSEHNSLFFHRSKSRSEQVKFPRRIPTEHLPVAAFGT